MRFCVVLQVLCGVFTPSLGQAQYYVSSTLGNDGNAGTSPTAPLRSVNIAVQRAVAPATIFLSGTFLMTESITLGGNNNGLVFDQWPGQPKAILSGGEPVTGWKNAGGVWSTPVSEKVAAVLAQKESGFIYVNGQRRIITRTPTMHWPLNGKLPGPMAYYGFQVNPGDIDPSWSLDPSSLKQWRFITFHSWVGGIQTVAEYIQQNHTFIFNEKALFAYGDEYYCSDGRYYIEGIPEHPLAEGTWRMDPIGPTLLYKPIAGEAFPPASVIVPVLGGIFDIQSTGNVTIQNINLEYTFSGGCGEAGPACDCYEGDCTDPVIFCRNSHNVSITNVIFRSDGGGGIGAQNCAGMLVNHISVIDSGATAVSITLSDDSTVNDTIVNGYGKRFPTGTGITMGSKRSTVSHNDICCGRHSGLSGGGYDDAGAFSHFEFNYVHHVGSDADDGVCDFGGYHGSTTGSVLPIYMTSNRIHAVKAYANGGVGIYMDVSSTMWQLERNLIYDVQGPCIQWNVKEHTKPAYGNLPTVMRNNVMIANTDNQFGRTQGVKNGGLSNPVIKWNGYTPSVFTHNVMYVDATTATSRGAWLNGNPCAYFLGPSDNCSWNYLDNFSPSQSSNNIWWNATAGAHGVGSATFPANSGECTTLGPNPSVRDLTKQVQVCRSLAQFQQHGKEAGSVSVDPQISGLLKLVTSPVAEQKGISALTEIDSAGAYWQLCAPSCASKTAAEKCGLADLCAGCPECALGATGSPFTITVAPPVANTTQAPTADGDGVDLSAGKGRGLTWHCQFLSLILVDLLRHLLLSH